MEKLLWLFVKRILLYITGFKQICLSVNDPINYMATYLMSKLLHMTRENLLHFGFTAGNHAIWFYHLLTLIFV